MANRIDLSNILINFLKKARYERHIEEGTLEENQFYAVTDGNEKTEYGDLFGNIENQADLYNALYASRLFKMEMCNDIRGYDIVHKLYDRREFDLSKFTVVGNPTISEDGVLTTSNRSNKYVKISLQPLGDNWDIVFPYSKPQAIDWHIVDTIFRNNNNYWAFSIGSYGGQYYLWLKNINDENLSTAFTAGFWASYGDCLIKLSCRVINDIYTLNIYSSFDYGNNWNLDKTITSSVAFYPCNNTMVDVRINTESKDTGAYIDLKYFSVTVDGTKVISGSKDFKRYDTYTLPSSEVITIPYILSVDGVKIVDVAYKPLVDQLYTETGMGNYIIIDETNKTFRLPLPDIYSQIENKTSFTLRKWED